MKQELLKVISVAKMSIDLSAAKLGPVDLFTIIGQADGVQVGAGQDGNSWYKLKGSFEATRLSDGQVFVAGATFISPAVDGLLAAKVQDSPGVRFAFLIGAKPSKTPIGYEYTVKTLMEEAPSEAFADLRALTVAAVGDTPAALESGKGGKK